MTQRFSCEFQVQTDNEMNLCDLLHQRTGLSKAQIKRALQHGACQMQRSGLKKNIRIRRAKATIHKGDLISFHYNQEILALRLPPPKLIADCTQYTVWDKPAGMLSQGTQFADHCSILRHVEILFKNKRQVYLVHRLDREASGLILLAHNKKTAALFSDLFQKHRIQKIYLVEVLGNLQTENLNHAGLISTPLDGTSAETAFSVLSYSSATNTSKITVEINSGRYHQIRRHFDSIDHPVIGDPKYGTGNKNTKGLRLRAIGLSFTCPISHKRMDYRVEGM